MFRGLLNDAKSAASAVLVKYAARASVAVPFIIAFGFATAAATVYVVERYGAITGYSIVAAAFTAIGVIAALVVGIREKQEEIADAKAEQSDTAEVASDATAQAAVQLPIALLGALATSPTSAMGLVRVLGRNLPLVALLVILGVLFWPSEPAAARDQEEGEEAAPPPKPNGVHRTGDEFGRGTAW